MFLVRRISSSFTSKPFILESSHPYEHNLDQYFPIKIPGAKRLKVIFDPQTATEGDRDWMRFYRDSSYSTAIAGADQFSGGKDGGSNNWPGQWVDIFIIF